MNKSKLFFVACYLLTVGCTAGSHIQTTDADLAGNLRRKLESADAAFREARLMEAESLFRELAQAHPRLPDVWLQLGNIYARQSQIEAAIRSYKDGLRFAPEDGRLWHNLALMELRQSIATLETASELLPVSGSQRGRIDDLHQALLDVGRAHSDAAQ